MSLKRFHEELENITNDLADYGDYALGMLTDGMASLQGLDTARANDVMDRKAHLYDLHSALEDRTMRLCSRCEAMWGPAPWPRPSPSRASS